MRHTPRDPSPASYLSVLKPLWSLDAVSPTWLSQSFEHSVWTDNRNDGQFETINMTLLDYYVRMPAVGRSRLGFHGGVLYRVATNEYATCACRRREDSSGRSRTRGRSLVGQGGQGLMHGTAPSPPCSAFLAVPVSNQRRVPPPALCPSPLSHPPPRPPSIRGAT